MYKQHPLLKIIPAIPIIQAKIQIANMVQAVHDTWHYDVVDLLVADRRIHLAMMTKISTNRCHQQQHPQMLILLPGAMFIT